MGNIQEATDTKSESSVEHDMNSSSTSEAGQLPADPMDKKHSEMFSIWIALLAVNTLKFQKRTLTCWPLT
jgi:hypothetical protein